MRAPTTSVLFLALLLTAPLAAQALPLPIESRGHPLDSGYFDHGGENPSVVFDAEVHVEDAAWLRVHFGDTNLPAGSHLRLVSRKDGAVQRFDMGSLRDYGFGSAYFNGSRVRVQLVAGPGTRGNRVQVLRVELQPISAGQPDSICGNTDDRTLLADPRVGRGVSGASACTWWLANEFTVLTAGHCTPQPSSTPWIVGFDIPLSTSGGVLVHPGPDDQYAVDLSSVRRLNSGIGADWAVMATVRNSNHGLYPGQKQGSWFQIGSVPGQIGGVDIRITGNGRVSPPVSPTWNAVTKTHVGPRVSISTANAIAYQTDTTGGNSGSPVIHEQTGEAIGVHTHGGCNSVGSNRGTRIDRADLAQALAQVMSSRVAGSFRVFGQGCGGAAVPQLGFSGIPDIGNRVTVDLSNLPASQFGIVVIGFTATNTNLAAFGLPNCTLLITADLQQFVASGTTGATSWSFGLPNSTSLVSTRAYFQYFVADPSVTTSVRAALSNGGEVLVGG